MAAIDMIAKFGEFELPPPQLEYHEHHVSFTVRDYPECLPIFKMYRNIKMTCRFKNNTLWNMNLDITNALENEGPIFMSAMITRVDRREINMDARLNVKLLDLNHVILFDGKWNVSVLPHVKALSPTFFTRIENDKLYCLPRKQLVIEWRLMVWNCCNDNLFAMQLSEVKARSSEPEFRPTDLQTCLYTAFLLDESKDVILKNGLDAVMANRFILSARSPVFRKIFTEKHGVDNDDPNVTFDADVLVYNVQNPWCKERGALDVFMIYLYCAVLRRVSPAMLCSVYALSHQFEVNPLQVLCSSGIKDHLSLGNICEVIGMAYLYNDNHLIGFIFNFIENNLMHLQNNDDFIALRSHYPQFEHELSQLRRRVINRLHDPNRYS